MFKRSIPPNHYFLKDMNPVIRLLIISDTVFIGAAGLLGPIFALFIEDFIQGGNAAVAGLAAGIFLFSIFYLVINTPLQLYLIQFILGLFTAFTFPTYMAIFTRHIDKEKEGTEWGVYFTLTDLTSAALASVGGFLATTQGFPTLIFTVVILSTIGSLILWPIKPYIKPAPRKQVERAS